MGTKANVLSCFLVTALIGIATSDASACETSDVVLRANLDSRTPTTSEFDASLSPAELLTRASLSTTIDFFDSGSGVHTLTVLFFNTEQADQWAAYTFINSAELASTEGYQPVTTVLNFQSDGTRPPLIRGDLFFQPLVWASGEKNSQLVVRFDLTSLESSTNFQPLQDGKAGACFQNGNLDYDGDGTDDYAIFRPSLGLWAVNLSSSPESVILKQWGLPGDRPMTGDYTGDGLADLVVWRPANGTWYVCRSEASFNCSAAPSIVQFGLPGDEPIEGDFTGDRILDFAVWRPSTGTFFVRDSSTGNVTTRQWGLPGDIPQQSGSD